MGALVTLVTLYKPSAPSGFLGRTEAPCVSYRALLLAKHYSTARAVKEKTKAFAYNVETEGSIRHPRSAANWPLSRHRSVRVVMNLAPRLNVTSVAERTSRHDDFNRQRKQKREQGKKREREKLARQGSASRRNAARSIYVNKTNTKR